MLCLLVLLTLTFTGCKSAIRVYSNPPGGTVIVDGAVQPHVTPTGVRIYGSGAHEVAVHYGSKKSEPQKVVLHTNGGKIFLAIILPIPMLFIYAAKGFCSPVPNTVSFDMTE